MAIITSETAREFLNIVANVPVDVPFPLFAETEAELYYGNAGAEATRGVDYTIELIPTEFNTFRFTPTTTLLDKINALVIAGDPEANRVVIRRVLPLTTTATPGSVQNTVFTSREFDRVAMKLMQLSEKSSRSVSLGPGFVGSGEGILIEELVPGRVLMADSTASGIVAGPNAEDIAGAQEFAASASVSAQAAAEAAEAAQAAAAGVEDPVSYSPQVLTTSQQDQARANIGIRAEVYADRAELALKVVPANVSFVRLTARTVSHPQSKGGLYKRVTSDEAAPWPSRSVAPDFSGAQFLLQAEGGVVYPEQLGAYPTIVVEAETKAWYDACSVKPTYLHLMHVDRTIRRMKWRGLWTKITQFLSVGGEAQADAGINIKSPGTLNATLAGTGTFTPGVGFKGNGTNGHVALGNWTSLITQNAAFLMASFIPTSDSVGYVVSSVGGASGGVGINPSTGTNMGLRLNAAATDTSVTRNYRDSDLLLSRRSSANYQLFEDGELAVSITAASVAVSADAGVLLRSGGGYTNETIRAFVVGNVALNADGSDAKFLTWIMKEHVAGLAGVVGKGPSVDSIGFVSVLTDAQRLAGMTHAAEFAQRAGVDLVIGLGCWSVSGPLPLMKTGLSTRGVSRRGTILMAANTGFSTSAPVVSPGHYDGGEKNWSIDNLTIDGRAAARGVTDVGTFSRPGPSNASTDGSRYFRLTRLDILDPVLHGIDYSNSGLLNASGVRVYSLVDAIKSYKSGVNGADCFIDDIWSEECGDDHVTAHFSFGGVIQHVKGFFSSCRHRTGGQDPAIGWRVSNVVEIDDGADGISVEDVKGFGMRGVVVVKSHNPSPTPRACFLENIRGDFCTSAVMLSNSTLGVESSNHVLRGVFFSNPWMLATNDATEFQAVNLVSCAGADVSGVHVKARGTETNLGAAIALGSGSVGVHVDGFIIENWRAADALDNGATVRMTSTSNDCSISNGRITGAGLRGIQDLGARNDINNVSLTGTGVASSVGVQGNAATSFRAIKVVSGFTTPTSGI